MLIGDAQVAEEHTSWGEKSFSEQFPPKTCVLEAYECTDISENSSSNKDREATCSALCALSPTD